MTEREFKKIIEENPEIKILAGPIPEPPILYTSSSNAFARKFESTWEASGGPFLLREYKFHPARRWRADYCHLATKVIIELEGGVWDGGRHTRGPGFINDIAKYNAATMLGYRVLRIPTGGVQADKLEQMIQFIKDLAHG